MAKAKSNLSAARLRELLFYDECTGVFKWRVNRARSARAGDVAGTNGRNYFYIGIDGKSYTAHRLAWLYVHGEHPVNEIDHIDRNKLNNRIANLRDVGRSENNQNIEALGCSLKRGRYVAQIVSNGKYYGLGSYATQKEATEAYLAAKRAVHAGSPINQSEATPADFGLLPKANGLFRSNTSGHTGVSFKSNKNKYEAHIRLNGKYKFVGSFVNLADAVAARSAALLVIAGQA